MKPILFAANAQSFSNNGIGRLDLVKCVVTEERNGIYELAAEISVDSPHFSDIANNMIIYAVPGDGMGAQPFRIYRISEPLNGLVTIDARHISYDLSYNTAMPYTAGSVSEAFVNLKAAAVETCPFTFWTDKSTVASQKITTPRSMRACLGGQQGSILDIYGGEFGWDNFQVKLYGQRGSDTAVTLRYGKNITDLTQEQNLENVITGIVPFWASEDSVVTLPEKSIDSAYASSYPYKRTVPVDFSSDFENAPTAAQLRARGQSYITANNIGVPKVSIKVSFVALWQTEEYKDIAPLERVNLCDTVGVVFERYGINTRAKVIRTEWDVLAERYLSIELGEARSNLASTIVKIDDETKQEVADTKTELQSAIEAASAAISGVDGGYLKIKSNADGKPYEMLIMDTESESTAEVIWRYNLAGWAAWIAAWGYNIDGTRKYRLAATLNPVNGAQINADYITAGTMVAERIRGGVLQSSDDPSNPNFILNLATGLLTAKQLQIISTNFSLTYAGDMTATNAKLYGSLKSNDDPSDPNFNLTMATGALTAKKLHILANKLELDSDSGKIISSDTYTVSGTDYEVKTVLDDGTLEFYDDSVVVARLKNESQRRGTQQTKKITLALYGDTESTYACLDLEFDRTLSYPRIKLRHSASDCEVLLQKNEVSIHSDSAAVVVDENHNISIDTSSYPNAIVNINTYNLKVNGNSTFSGSVYDTNGNVRSVDHGIVMA